MTQLRSNIPQIEKETLGIIFAVTKFHRYLHGRRFILQTDHKPLTIIFGSKKGLPVYTANRLLRWGTILLNYHFKIEFLTSKDICHVDSSSRLIPQNTEVFEDSIIATLRTNLRNQKQCSQEKSSPSSIDSFHGKQSSRKPSRPIRNISFLAIKSFSRPIKTTLHYGKWAPSNKGLANWSILSRDQKTPTNAIWTSSGNGVRMNLRNHQKYLRRADRRNIRSFRSTHASNLSGSATLGKKKKIYATTRRKSQEEEILIVLFFSKKKKKTLERGRGLWDRNLPASWTIPALYY